MNSLHQKEEQHWYERLLKIVTIFGFTLSKNYIYSKIVSK